MRNFHPKVSKGLIIAVILLGIGFRFVNLDRKGYWHDEVYTTIRAAGFTRYEIDQELFQNHFVSAPALQKFQQLKSGSSSIDTINSLVTEDPQHPPLYFLLARFWMQRFGSSILASRFLPALLSLLSLPLMYQLAMVLFASQKVALLATMLLALSPLDILFAQTARQYGLLTTTIIGTNWALLRALRRPTRLAWGWYILGTTIGLYTHPFFSLTLIAQGIYVLLLIREGQAHEKRQIGQPSDSEENQEKITVDEPPLALTQSLPKVHPQSFLPFSIAVTIAFGLYTPWLTVLLTNPQGILGAVGWTSAEVPLHYLTQQWMLNFTALFVNFNGGFDNPWNRLLCPLFVCLILIALYAVSQGTVRSTWLFILTAIGVPFLIFVLPDLLLGGKRSAISRYLVACYPGIQLAVAYLLAVALARSQTVGQGLFALILSCSLVSCSLNALADTSPYQETSYTNPEVLHLLTTQTAIPAPIVVSDTGDGDTNIGDLIALSYALPDNIQLFMASRSPNLDILKNKSTVFVFRPSEQIREVFTQQGWQLEEVVRFGTLWRADKRIT